MKKMIWIISLLCMATATGCMQDDPTYFQKPDWWVDGEQDEEGDGEYRLVWSEEFDEEPPPGRNMPSRVRNGGLKPAVRAGATTRNSIMSTACMGTMP